jgi:hypothetical protein
MPQMLFSSSTGWSNQLKLIFLKKHPPSPIWGMTTDTWLLYNPQKETEDMKWWKKHLFSIKY